MEWHVHDYIVPKNPLLSESTDVQCTMLIIVAETMELGPVGLEPEARTWRGWHGVSHEPPKARAVIHFAHVGDFMRCDIIQNKWRRKDEPP